MYMAQSINKGSSGFFTDFASIILNFKDMEYNKLVYQVFYYTLPTWLSYDIQTEFSTFSIFKKIDYFALVSPLIFW